MVVCLGLTLLGQQSVLMYFAVMLHEYSPGESLSSAALMHHANPTGLIHYLMLGMIHQRSASELLVVLLWCIMRTNAM